VQDTFKSVEVEEMVLGSFEDTLYVPEESCDTSHDVENDETEEMGDNSECDIFEKYLAPNCLQYFEFQFGYLHYHSSLCCHGYNHRYL
jgi:hypothetical protein